MGEGKIRNTGEGEKRDSNGTFFNVKDVKKKREGGRGGGTGGVKSGGAMFAVRRYG